MQERRRFPRLGITKIMVNWRKDGILDNLHRTKNISGGGIGLAMGRNNSAKTGDALQLEFYLPTGRIIYAKGIVAWTNKSTVVSEENITRSEAGIEFSDISDKDKEFIKSFVSSNLALNQRVA